MDDRYYSYISGGHVHFAIETSTPINNDHSAAERLRVRRSPPVTRNVEVLLWANEGARTWDGVAGRLGPVQLELDSRITAFICAWEADCWRIRSASTSNVELSTLLNNWLALWY